jgi:hypothetical protein
VIKTDRLIDEIAARADPVRRLRRPTVRLIVWLAAAMVTVAAIALVHGLRPDLSSRLAEPHFTIPLAMSIATGVVAALAALNLSLPDRSSAWLLLPLPTLLVWLSGIGYGCLAHWIPLTPESVTLGGSLRCLSTIVLTSLPLSFLSIVMLRHALPIRPLETMAAGSLAVTAFAASAVTLLHDLEATALVLAWNLGAVAMTVLLGGLFGRALLASTLSSRR